MHVTKRLLEMNNDVVGIDNLNSYYDIKLKKKRLQVIKKYKKFVFVKLDIINKTKLSQLFKFHNFDIVINLAAQAGVRHSIEKPKKYIDANIIGFFNILECCKNYHIKHLVFASSSSVYGLNKKRPFKEKTNTDEPVSLYGATKKTNEILAHSYSKMYCLQITGLRFFTVYGPWGRPDMAPFIFSKAILNDKPINLFNYGNMIRDFTYIDDIVESLVKVTFKNEKDNKSALFNIYNIGNSKPIKLLDFLAELELCFKKVAIKNYLPMQNGDVYATQSDSNKLSNLIKYKPKTNFKKGIKKFVEWYLDYY